MVFLFIFFSICFIGIILVFSKIRIEFVNIKFSSKKERHWNQDYEITVSLCILGVIPILKIRLVKSKLEKMKFLKKLRKMDFTVLEEKVSWNKEMLQKMKHLDILIKKFNLRIDLGTESSFLTSILVPAISTIIAIVLKKKIKKWENQIFIINPIYQNQNLVKIDFSGIFEIKISHIITIMYDLMKKEKKGVKKYERTSNRGAYDYSYE